MPASELTQLVALIRLPRINLISPFHGSRLAKNSLAARPMWWLPEADEGQCERGRTSPKPTAGPQDPTCRRVRAAHADVRAPLRKRPDRETQVKRCAALRPALDPKGYANSLISMVGAQGLEPWTR